MSIDDKVTKGNVTVFYNDDRHLTVKVRGLRLGSEKVDVEYTCDSSTYSSMGIRHGRMSCDIVSFDTMPNERCQVSVPSDEHNGTPEEMRALHWTIANDCLGPSASKVYKQRQLKAMGLWLAVYREMVQIPLVQKYMQGHRRYVEEARRADARTTKESEERHRRNVEKWKKEHLGKPDPFDALAALAEPALKQYASAGRTS